MGQAQVGPVPTAPVPAPVQAPPQQPLSSSHYSHINKIAQVPQSHPNPLGHMDSSTSGSQSACVPASTPLTTSIPTTGPAPGQPAPQNQPVEFNHAINYVNKIKVWY